VIPNIPSRHSWLLTILTSHDVIFWRGLKYPATYSGNMDTPDANQLPILIKEWMHIDTEIQSLSAEIRERRKRSATVRGMILSIMKAGQIGQLNISAGAVVARTTKVKATMSKKYILNTLIDFFGGDKTKAETCAAFLEEHRPLKNKDNLTLEPKA